MPYEIYIDDMLLPLPPEKIPVSYNGQNKTVSLINGEEINLIKPAGLSDISFDIIIPQMDYPSAVWTGSINNAEDFLERLRDLKKSKRPFELIIIRRDPAGKSLFDTSMDVTLEDYKVSDDVGEGFDLKVNLSMKEYRYYGTKIMNFTIDDKTGTDVSQNDMDRQGEPLGQKNYTVVKGDCLWLISKKQLGDGNRWQEIYKLNQDKVKNPNLIYPGQVLIMP